MIRYRTISYSTDTLRFYERFLCSSAFDLHKNFQFFYILLQYLFTYVHILLYIQGKNYYIFTFILISTCVNSLTRTFWMGYMSFWKMHQSFSHFPSRLQYFCTVKCSNHTNTYLRYGLTCYRPKYLIV